MFLIINQHYNSLKFQMPLFLISAKFYIFVVHEMLLINIILTLISVKIMQQRQKSLQLFLILKNDSSDALIVNALTFYF